MKKCLPIFFAVCLTMKYIDRKILITTTCRILVSSVRREVVKERKAFADYIRNKDVIGGKMGS